MEPSHQLRKPEPRKQWEATQSPIGGGPQAREQTVSHPPRCLWSGFLTSRTGFPAPFPCAQGDCHFPAPPTHAQGSPCSQESSWAPVFPFPPLLTPQPRPVSTSCSSEGPHHPRHGHSDKFSHHRVSGAPSAPARDLALSWSGSPSSDAPPGLLSRAPLQPLSTDVPRTLPCSVFPPSGKTTCCRSHRGMGGEIGAGQRGLGLSQITWKQNSEQLPIIRPRLNAMGWSAEICHFSFPRQISDNPNPHSHCHGPCTSLPSCVPAAL